VFVGFTLLGGGGQLVGQLVQNRGSDALALGEDPVVTSLVQAVAGMVLSLVCNLWLNVGLLRGAWIALEGRRPRLAELARWDGAAMARLLAMGLLLLLINLLILATAGLAAGLISLVHPLLALIPLLAGGGLVAALVVAQIFHLPLIVAGDLRPVEAFRTGQVQVGSRWARQCGLTVALGLIVLLPLGLALLIAWPLGLGVLVTWPLALCTLTSAYQELCGSDDRGGLLAVR
jgi:hypothetical protein